MPLPQTRRHLLVALVALALSLTAALVGAGPASATGTAQINGTVTGRTGSLLGGIRVELWQPGNVLPNAATFTASDGTYHFGSLAAGDYEVWFKDLSHNVLDEIWNDKDTLNSGDLVHVADGGSGTADAVLTDGGHISGVLAVDGVGPLAGATVTALRATGWQEISSTTTGPDGSYELTKLIAGSYRVKFSAPGYRTTYWGGGTLAQHGPRIAIARDALVTGKDALIEEGRRIRGTVLNPDSDPAINIQVVPWIWGGGSHWDVLDDAATLTAADGSYELAGLTPGTYRIQFRDQSGHQFAPQFYDGTADGATDVGSALSVNVTAAGVAEDVNAQMANGGHITGAVTGPGATPLAGVAVWVYRSGASEDEDPVVVVTTDGSGNYDVGSLATGGYRLVVKPDGASGLLDGLADDVFATVATTQSGVDVELLAGGVVSGTVVGPTGDPAPNTRVSAYAGGHDEETRFAMSDGAGHYDLAGLPPGSYVLKFEDNNDSGFVDQWWAHVATRAAATPIVVVAGGSYPGKDAQMLAGGVVTGTVTGPDDLPLEHVIAIALRPIADGWDFAGAGETDAGGHYAIEGLRPGSYRIRFADQSGHHYAPEYWNDAASLASATDIVVTAGTTTSGRNAKLGPGGDITGTVTGPDHAPLEGAEVFAFLYSEEDDGWDLANVVATDPSGHYDLNELAPGTYRIAFQPASNLLLSEYWNDAETLDSATDITVAAGQTVPGRDAELRFAGAITGVVTDPSDAPLAGVAIAAYLWSDFDQAWEFYTEAETDAAGAYRVDSLPPGRYHLGFQPDPSAGYAEEWWDNATSVDTATDVVVAQSTVTGKNAKLAVGAGISGTVTGPTGLPVNNVRVSLYRLEGGDWDLVGIDNTLADGGYEFTILPAGTYRLGFKDNSSHGYATEYWNDSATLEEAGDITVPAGANLTGEDAQLALGAHLQGTVTGPGGPLAGVFVTAYAQVGGGWTLAANGVTDASGGYDIGALPVGSYRIGFDDHAQGLVTEYWDDAGSLESATTIPVAAGSIVTDKDALLVDGGRITGTVTGPGGAALTSDVEVTAYTQVDGDWVAAGSSAVAGDGSYTVDSLRTGTYRLQFAPEMPQYRTEYWNDVASLGAATGIAVTIGQTVSGKNAALALTPLSNTAAPEIAGTPAVGSLLSATTGAWTPNLGLHFSYRWLVGGTAVPGATGSTYTPVAADIGKTVVVEVTASKSKWGSSAKTSAATAAIPALPPTAVLNTGQPGIGGTPKVGSTVTATPGTWTPSSATVSYQWLVGGTVVASGPTYTPVGADAGKSLQVRATATAPGLTAATSVSPVKTIGTGTLVARAKPKLTGTAKKNATLKVTAGTWTPSAVTVKIQWYANNKPIAKATAGTLKLTGKTLKAVAGKTITVKVTVTARGYNTVVTTLKAPGKAKA